MSAHHLGLGESKRSSPSTKEVPTASVGDGQLPRPGAFARFPWKLKPFVDDMSITRCLQARIVQLDKVGDAPKIELRHFPFDAVDTARSEMVAHKLPFVVERWDFRGFVQPIHIDDPQLVLY